MPQSTNVTANQMRNIPDQAAEAAATGHGKETHLSAHEETAREQDAEKHADAHTPHATEMHHGKAARLEHEREK